jgi:hypothetical protein
MKFTLDCMNEKSIIINCNFGREQKPVLDSLWYHRANVGNNKRCTLIKNVGSIYIQHSYLQNIAENRLFTLEHHPPTP